MRQTATKECLSDENLAFDIAQDRALDRLGLPSASYLAIYLVTGLVSGFQCPSTARVLAQDGKCGKANKKKAGTLTKQEAIARARRSPKFTHWQYSLNRVFRKSRDGSAGWVPRKTVLQESALEKHYSPSELAKIRGLSVETIRRMFEGERGVLIIGSNGTRSKRRYRTFRIPEQVAIRLHRKLSAP